MLNIDQYITVSDKVTQTFLMLIGGAHISTLFASLLYDYTISCLKSVITRMSNSSHHPDNCRRNSIT